MEASTEANSYTKVQLLLVRSQVGQNYVKDLIYYSHCSWKVNSNVNYLLVIKLLIKQSWFSWIHSLLEIIMWLFWVKKRNVSVHRSFMKDSLQLILNILTNILFHLVMCPFFYTMLEIYEQHLLDFLHFAFLRPIRIYQNYRQDQQYHWFCYFFSFNGLAF